MRLARLSLALTAALAGCAERIQHGLDERQANELQSALGERGFEAKKVPEKGKKPSWAVEVSSEQAADAVRVLAELGLPRPKTPTTLDVLGSGGLVPTPVEERTRQMVGLAGDLAATLETVDGVNSARVHLALPPPARPGQAAGQAKASAFLRVRPGAAARLEGKRDELRALIAGSVEGLAQEQVTLFLSEVESSVPTPVRGPTPAARLRWLVILLSVSTSLLAVALVVLTLRLRRFRSRVAAAATPPAPPKPVVAPARRAA
ncbi:MAG: flagellar M-ring protein FliF [Myxococcales bacterium]|nr:flagellar M-ring protein FliF [Myxococcales bacterium]